MPEHERVLVRGVGKILVRPLRRPDDDQAFLRFGAAMTPGDLRLRFAGPINGSLLAAQRLLALGGTAFAAFDGHGEILGVGQVVANEIALTVRSDLKRRGLGRTLLERLLRHAIEHGVTELAGAVLAENRAMLALARTAGFRATGFAGTMVSLRLCLP
jgi:acetyltransferase